jgi:hypothetical protein
MSEQNQKVFKGVWIPAEIWTLDALTWMEKCLWAEISFLGTPEKPCFATNAYLAKVFHSTESSIANMISNLKYYRMIKYIGSDGRFRKMIAVVPEVPPVKRTRNPPRRSEGSHHAGVNPDFTQECNRDTNTGSKVENPLTPLTGGTENSPMGSHSEDGFAQLRSALNGDKEVNADAIDSRPPHQCKPASSAVRQKSPQIELPHELDCPDLRSAWNDFVDYRKERKKPVTPTTAKILFNRMKAWGADTSADALRDSIANGWQGVFPPKESNRPNVI